MSEEKEREVAHRLILESIVDSKLDFNLLLRKTNDLAQKRVDDKHGKDNDYASEVKSELQSLTYATRQVLGFVPEKKWSYDNWLIKQYEERIEGKSVHWEKRTLADFQKEHGLEIFKKDGSRYVAGSSTSSEPGADTDKRLSDFYVITVSATKEKEIKGSALNTTAAILRSVVETAHSSQSVAGQVIHEDEAKTIERKMQNFIGEYNKAPVILTELAKKDIKDALATLDKAAVKADYPELGKEMNDLQNILKTQEMRKPVLDSTTIKKPGAGRH